MSSEPQRREQRRTHLDASVVPVERALLHRAEELFDRAGRQIDNVSRSIDLEMSAEFRALAEELHWQ
jgi:hypothetical protein